MSERDSLSRDLTPDEARIILDSVADGVFTVNGDFTITSFNRAAERITGFTAAEAIGEKCYNVFRTRVCDDGCLLRESIRTGRRITGFELSILDREDQEVPISISTAVLRREGGEAVGGVETFRDLSAVAQLRQELQRRHTLHDMVSKNHRMQQIFALIPDLGPSSATVLIQGETGTGKGLLARAIHEESERAKGPFVEVNCGALPDSLLESELFGHVAGAFTDARGARIGRFELANGGTIFLDEVGDTSPSMQVKLLRVIQDGCFEPVGSAKTRTTDVRVLAATHRDLKMLVGAGVFRHDLFYRINTVQLTVPPLRDRREDIPLLVDHFIQHFNEMTGKRVRSASGRAMRALMLYPWPGNVRELEHAVEHAFVLAKGATLHLQHLPAEVAEAALRPRTDDPPPAKDARTVLAEAEREAIVTVLRRHDWDKARVCRELGISRSTLWRRMRKLGIPLQPESQS